MLKESSSEKEGRKERLLEEEQRGGGEENSRRERRETGVEVIGGNGVQQRGQSVFNHPGRTRKTGPSLFAVLEGGAQKFVYPVGIDEGYDDGEPRVRVGYNDGHEEG